MKIVSIVKYRLHRFFFSSRPVIPLIVTMCFLGSMYSIRPMNIGSGYVLSGVFQFILMTFLTLSINGTEAITEEQLVLFHGNTWSSYCVAREITLILISCVYSLLLTLYPIVINCCNGFSFFTRALTAYDVSMGAIILFGSSLAGIAIGDLFHPRIMSNRKLSISIAIGVMLCSIAKDAMIAKSRFLAPLNVLLPSVMKPAGDLGNGDYFAFSSIISFLFQMILYYCVIAAIKNIILYQKKFS